MKYNSKNLREREGYHGQTLSVGTGYQLCPVQPSRECRREILFHQSQETANDSGQRIPPIVLPVELTKPS